MSADDKVIHVYNVPVILVSIDLPVHTGCFINYVTILNLYIIKISTLNCLTSKYYKNIVICILFGIKIYPYFHNLGLSYETFKKAQFL